MSAPTVRTLSCAWLEDDLPRTRNGCVITPAGVVIGGGFIGSQPMQSADADAIQCALLGVKPMTRIKTRPSLLARIWRWIWRNA